MTWLLDRVLSCPAVDCLYCCILSGIRRSYTDEENASASSYRARCITIAIFRGILQPAVPAERLLEEMTSCARIQQRRSGKLEQGVVDWSPSSEEVQVEA